MATVTPPVSDWYSQPLVFEDIFAGGFLLLVSAGVYPISIIVCYIMIQNDKEIIGFRYLFSASIVDMMLLLNYALWPGITILFKSEILPVSWRSPLQIYMDWAWFSSCYHYMIIAWTRYAAIRHPTFFRSQSKLFSYSLCGLCYAASLIQTLATHFQPWYVTFYYDPAAYGMSAEDYVKYLTQGQSLFFLCTHLVTMIIPIGFYIYAIVFLLKHRNGAKPTSKAMSVEAKLLLPCIFNTVIFIIGQVVITIGTGSGKWAMWLVLILFTCNAAFNPFLLILFSGVIRKRFWSFLHGESVTSTSIMQRSQWVETTNKSRNTTNQTFEK